MQDIKESAYAKEEAAGWRQREEQQEQRHHHYHTRTHVRRGKNKSTRTRSTRKRNSSSTTGVSPAFPNISRQPVPVFIKPFSVREDEEEDEDGRKRKVEAIVKTLANT